MLGRKQEEKPQPECVCVVRMWMRVCLRKKRRQKPENYTSHTGWRRTLARNEGKLIFPTSLIFASAWKQANTAHVSSCLTFVRYRDTTRYSGESAKEVLENRDFFTEPFSVCIRCAWRKYEQLVKRRKTHPHTHTHPVEKKKEEDDDDESKW